MSLYRYSGYFLAQMGSTIDGESGADESGSAISLSSDGLTVAIGAFYNDGTTGNSSDERGHVRVYKWRQFTSNDVNNYNYESRLRNSTYTKPVIITSSLGTAPSVGSFYWTQIGQDIDGESEGDQSGWTVSLSADGLIVAIGAPNSDVNGTSTGQTRIYEYISSSWTLKGYSIDGEVAADLSGYSVSLSAVGLTVAIGAINNDGNSSSSGHVRVYEWRQFTSNDVNNYNYQSRLRNSTYTKPLIITSSLGTAPSVGSFYWTQLGQDIDGEAGGDQSGYSVSFSNDASIIAIGARTNDGNGGNSGHVRVYEWRQFTSNDVNNYNYESRLRNSTYTKPVIFTSSLGTAPSVGSFYWTQIGQDIDGEVAADQFGYFTSLSGDGLTVVGSSQHSNTNSGSVRVFRYNGSGWIQLGSTILSEASGDLMARVSLSENGSILAVGARGNDGGGGNSGHVRVYQWREFEADDDDDYNYDSRLNNNTYTKPIIITSSLGTAPVVGSFYWTQMGNDIDGEGANNFCETVSLSADGLTVAVGSWYDIGKVKVYTFEPSLVPNCFPAGTLVTTDQGNVAIEKLKPKVHTISGNKIIAITQIMTLEKHIVSIEKDSLMKNVPCVTTQISNNHELFYKGKMTKACELVGICDGVTSIHYDGQTLYNVLLEKHGKMMINNLICETLHPNNIMARIITGKMSQNEKSSIFSKLNQIIRSYDLPAYKKLYASVS